ncbi:MAG TPA: HNH endonuclease [Vicinamibacteria bacterium]|nr:HNH endonuclease [Vicinamibacteria bacterium]
MGRKRAQAKAAGDLTPEQWSVIVATYGGLCAHCEQAPWAEQDHVVPIAKGGAHSAGNLVPACHACNQRKGRRTWWPRRRHPYMAPETQEQSA